jgi:hypothetical protein
MIDNNDPNGRQYTLDPNMEYDDNLDMAILALSKGKPFLRNLLNDERIKLMENHQSDYTHVIVRADGSKVYGRLIGDVTQHTNLS